MPVRLFILGMVLDPFADLFPDELVGAVGSPEVDVAVVQ